MQPLPSESPAVTQTAPGPIVDFVTPHGSRVLVWAE